MTEDWRSGGFGLYVHWPFCTAKCPYCDFNSHVSRQIDQGQWERAYLAEIARVAEETKGRVLNTLFFGGGTPSLMEPALVARIIDAVRSAWPMVNNPEITLEANPGSVESGRFRAFSEAGVTRVSMGVQALNDDDLRRLGRLHTVGEARTAFDIAQRHFERVSFDLIYARQHQSLDAWKAELTDALAMAADHLSLYQLTIEPGTAFGERFEMGKLAGLPPDDRAAEMFEATQDLCEAAGLPAYEISNHARPGAESRHNLIYWRYGDYAGIGPGAHGRLSLNETRYATETELRPADWLKAVENGSGEMPRAEISRREQADEYLMLCLRTSEGLDTDRYARLSGESPSPRKIEYLEDLGLLRASGSRLIATRSGRLLLNQVIRTLLAG